MVTSYNIKIIVAGFIHRYAADYRCSYALINLSIKARLNLHLAI